MNRFRDSKKVLVLLAFFFSIMSVLTFIIGISSQKINTYSIKIIGEKNDNSSSDAIFIEKINIRGTNISFDSFKNDVNTELKDNFLIIKKNSENDPIFTIKESQINPITIDFLKSNNSGKFIFSLNGVEKKIDLYSSTNATYHYEYSYRLLNVVGDYFKNITFINVLCLLGWFAASFVVLYFSLYLIKKTVSKIKSEKLKFTDIILSIISLFAIYLSCIYLFIETINVLTIIPILSVLAYFLYNNREIIKKKLEYAFIIIGVVVGITMLFFLPPFHVPDEGTHFVKSYEASQFNDENRITYVNGIKSYIYLPSDLDSFMKEYLNGVLSYDYTVSAKNYFFEMFHKIDYSNFSDEAFAFSNTSKLSVIPYIPSIIILMVTQLFSLPSLYMLLFGKLINLSIFLLVSYYALKQVKKFKKTFFLVMLFPMCIHQAAAINMDWLTNASFFLLAALLVNEIFSTEKISRKNLILITITAIILSLCKVGYFPLVFLVFLIPARNFDSRKKEWTFKILLPILMIFLTMYQYLFVNSGSGVNNYYQLSIIWKDPIKLLSICINTFINRIDLDMFRGLMDGFGWATVWHRALMGFIVGATYLVLLLSDEEDIDDFNYKRRFNFLVMSATMIGIVYAAMLFCWTKIGYDTIDGLQPRYFIPPALLFYISISNKYLKLNVKNKNLFYAFGIVLVYLMAFVTIICNYYV